MSNLTMRVASPRAQARFRAPAASWAATVVGLVGAIVVLHRLGRPGTEIVWSDLPAWLADHSTEQVALALTRVLALGTAYCTALGTVIDMIARLTGLPALVRSVEWATLPPVRRMAERVAAVAIGAASVAPSIGPSIGVVGLPPGPDAGREMTRHEVHPVILVVDEVPRLSPIWDPSAEPIRPAGAALPITLDRSVDPAPAVGAEADPPHPAATGATATVGPPPLTFLRQTETPDPDHATTTAESPAVRRAGSRVHPPARPTTQPSVTTEPATHRVVPGDHLWGIAAGRLTAAYGRAPSLTETASYWSEVVAANRGALRSGDPDLIFPGETITCPPVSAGP